MFVEETSEYAEVLLYAGVVESVDTQDLKSCDFESCQFESGHPHQILCNVNIGGATKDKETNLKSSLGEDTVTAPMAEGAHNILKS